MNESDGDGDDLGFDDMAEMNTMEWIVANKSKPRISTEDILEMVDFESEEEGEGEDVEIQNDSEAEMATFPALIGPSEPYFEPFEEELDDSDDLISLESESGQSDDEADLVKKKKQYPGYVEERDLENPDFEVGMLFSSSEEFKKALKQHSILKRKNFDFTTNEKWRVRAKCRKPCKWMIYASRENKKSTNLQVKTYIHQHNDCKYATINRNVTANWIAHQYVAQFASNPNIPWGSMKEMIKKEHKVVISKGQFFRAKKKALELLEGSHKEQYNWIWSYCAEVKRVMPNSTLRVHKEEIEGVNKFKRLYCCLGPLKEGFKQGCRPFIGLDGCFLKGPFPGQLLSAVGIDANNGMYPFAWAVVEKETKLSWLWFLKLVCDDIGIDEDNQRNYTFMSDQQKGLKEALKIVVPDSEVRFCVRHHHSNFRKSYSGKVWKELFWKCARASTLEYFEYCMEGINKKNVKALAWLKKGAPPQHWSRSHFQTHSKCDILINNHCEVFNGFIVDVRDKPIISMFEGIRNTLMDRIRKNREQMLNHPNLICPRIEKKLDLLETLSNDWICRHSGGDEFQVSCSPQVQFVVNLRFRTCSCRVWKLSGLPCVHAVSAILTQREEVSAYVHDYFTKAKYLETYDHIIPPMNGQSMWPKTNFPNLVPPEVLTQPGRKKKARNTKNDEHRRQGGGKLSKKRIILSCGKCGNTGHNARTCKGQSESSAASTGNRKCKVRRPTNQATLEPTGSQPQSSQGHAFSAV